MTRNQKRATAYHEAGHAYAAWRLNVGLRRRAVSILRDGDSAGRVLQTILPKVERDEVEYGIPSGSTGARENRAMVYLAGMVAQRKFNPRCWRSYHGQGDFEMAVHLIEGMSGSGGATALSFLLCRTKDLFADGRRKYVLYATP